MKPSKLLTSLKFIATTVLLGLAVANIGMAQEQSQQQFGADRHIARGLQCTNCHGQDFDPKDAEPAEQEACMQCHNKDALAEKTKGLAETVGANPHAAPHNNDCTLCHMQHEAPVNYCASCHTFEFNVK